MVESGQTHPTVPRPQGRARRFCGASRINAGQASTRMNPPRRIQRSEEHTSELQSPCKLVWRLLLEKKNWMAWSRVTVLGPAVVGLRAECESSVQAMAVRKALRLIFFFF